MEKIIAMVSALLFVFSLATVGIAAEKHMYSKEQIYSVRGPVLAVDFAAKTLTVKSVERSKSPSTIWKGDMTFSINDDTKVAMGKKVETFQYLKPGEKVTVKFHGKDGKYIADTIRIADGSHG